MHLPKFGWQVKVLTVEPRYYEEELDPELEELLPAELEIIRTRALPVKPLRLIGDIGIRAFFWHYRALCRLIKRERIDLIYFPLPPYYSALLGLLIFHRFGTPYAVDYIDPWVYHWSPSRRLFSKAWVSYHLARILEPLVLRHVSLIVAVAPDFKRFVSRYPGINAGFLAIPYGAEEEDFRYLDKKIHPAYVFDPDDGMFHIVYAGTMWPAGHYSLSLFFKALAFLRKDRPDLAKKVRINFIGTGSNYGSNGSIVRDYAEKNGISDMVYEKPERISYLDVLNHLKHASCVLILGSLDAHYTPSKVFQSVLSRNPVIAVLHQKSSAVKILRDVGAGKVITFDENKPESESVEGVARAVLETVEQDYSPEAINWQAFRAYSAEEMTRALAGAFDSVLGKGENK